MTSLTGQAEQGADTGLVSANAHLTAFYLSKDRLLALLSTQHLPPNVLAVLQGKNVPLGSAVLSNMTGEFVLRAVEDGEVMTLQQLAYEDRLEPGTPFVYHGHFYGKGFSNDNTTPHLMLHEKLDEPLAGKKLQIEFSKNGLTNDTAYTRMGGSCRLFAFAYISEVSDKLIRAIPFAIGDLVRRASGAFSTPFVSSLNLRLEAIAQFKAIDTEWTPTPEEFKRLRDFPEAIVKAAICDLLGEHEVPKDWGGEEGDLFTSNLLIGSVRSTGAFLLKGPAKFHPMKMTDCGKNGDQIYRLFNQPADVYVIQHCHAVTAAVRKTMEAFALSRSFTQPCRYMVIDGNATAQLLRLAGQWDVKLLAARAPMKRA